MVGWVRLQNFWLTIKWVGLGSLIFNPARGEPTRVSRVGSLWHVYKYGLNWIKETYIEIRLKSRQWHLVVILTCDIILSRGTNIVTCHTRNLTHGHKKKCIRKIKKLKKRIKKLKEPKIYMWHVVNAVRIYFFWKGPNCDTFSNWDAIEIF